MPTRTRYCFDAYLTVSECVQKMDLGVEHPVIQTIVRQNIQTKDHVKMELR